MFYLYVLKSQNSSRRYIGIAGNVDIRLHRHNSGHVASTKPYRPWNIVHTEEFRDKTSAREREVFLKKTARARTELFERIEALSSIG